MIRNHSALGFELRLLCYKLLLVGLCEIQDHSAFYLGMAVLGFELGLPCYKLVLVSLYEKFPVAFLSALN
jgi:hypothetical protein